jgi:PDZ domain
MESRVFGLFLLIFAAFLSGGSTNSARCEQPTSVLSQAFDQLHDTDFHIREAAAQTLLTAGKQSLPFLKLGLTSEQTETQWRCSVILEQLAFSDETLAAQVVELFRDLPPQQQAKFSRFTTELKDKRASHRHEQAVAQLQKLGAELQLPDPALDVDSWEGLVIDDVFDEFVDPAVFLAEGEAVILIDGEEIPLDLEAARELELAEFEEENEAAPPLPILAEKIVAALLPDGLRHVLGVPAEPIEVAEAPENADPRDFAIPALEAAGNEVASVLVDADEVEDWIAAPPGGLPAVDEYFNVGSLVIDDSFHGDDATLAALRDVKQLGVINIQGKKLSDAALEHIFAIGALQQLHVQHTQFSPQALIRQHRARPEVGIMAIGSAVMGVNASIDSAPCELRAVVPRSGAYQAGLRPGDVIESVDGEAIRDFSELTILIQSRQPGEELEVGFRRDARLQTVRVKLAARS